MRYSRYLMPTVKEAPADAVVISHILMIRAGMIRKLAAGIYNYLPLALRTIKKIETIIREEMDKAGAVELLMPAVQPAELWQESGRWSYYGPELLRFKDRKGAEFCIGPTHEEVITHIVQSNVKSYKELPLNLYQIQTKFRDEVRPRFGLMRGREFIMKDAYSFDLDEQGAIDSYKIMFETYKKIFTRCGLKFKAVEAGTGAIGGSLSHEFQVLAQSGEDTLLSCSSCDYAANIEKAECAKPEQTAADMQETEALPPVKEVATPNQKTIEEVTAFLKVAPERLCKSLLYLADRKPVLVLLRGDHELAEAKLTAALGCDELLLADDETIQKVTGAPTGFAGPVGLKESIPIYADWAIQSLKEGVTGANKKDVHFINVAAARDFPAQVQYHDLRVAQAGEPCPRCKQGVYELYKGIEVGQVFYLGTKYSSRMNATVLDENGSPRTVVMGCYGIGVTRTMAAAIEQNNDNDGIIWPFPLAPFHLIICPIGKDQAVTEVAERLYQQLLARGVEVLLDDRGERPGVMFKDADLIGIPLRLTIGDRNLKNNQVELKLRAEKASSLVAVDEAVETICKLLGEKLAVKGQ